MQHLSMMLAAIEFAKIRSAGFPSGLASFFRGERPSQAAQNPVLYQGTTLVGP
jgi:hypothetical protein